MSPLFDFKKAKCDFVISKELYDQQKDENKLYAFKGKLSGGGDKILGTAFKTTESFLKDITPSDAEKVEAEKQSKDRGILPQEAAELMLAKKSGATLVLSNKQVWLDSVARKSGVKTIFFR